VKTKVVMAWSGGKDSALALWRLQRDDRYQVMALLTTLTERYDRVQMHGTRRILLEAQAEALGQRLVQVWVGHQADNAAYEAAMAAALQVLIAEGVEAVAFGDLFLQEIRAYRERMLAPTGLQPLFPLWGEDTAQLARQMVRDGFRATLVCIDPRALPAAFAGRPFDEALLADLPAGVDPCGENGEFHTFVHDGPNFHYPLPTMLGTRVERTGFLYADLLPVARRGFARL
jgi:uncharacterized protein (TIGR00290 family)